MTLQELRDTFPGYHVTIEMWPTGGQIVLNACKHCGTSTKNYYEIWGDRRQSLQEAVEKLKEQVK